MNGTYRANYVYYHFQCSLEIWWSIPQTVLAPLTQHQKNINIYACSLLLIIYNFVTQNFQVTPHFRVSTARGFVSIALILCPCQQMTMHCALTPHHKGALSSIAHWAQVDQFDIADQCPSSLSQLSVHCFTIVLCETLLRK